MRREIQQLVAGRSALEQEEVLSPEETEEENIKH